MLTNAELLRRYAADRSEAAFAELVRRHLDGVYSSALRRVGFDTHLAQDVAQAVFITLARQSRALADHPLLTAWLYATTRNEAATTVRRERRRKTREAVASAMKETNTSSSAESAADWSLLSPILDDTIDQLSETDRAAILLRYIDRRPFAEIGARLRVTEDAARMRVDRALDKLRALLVKRGLTSTSAALAVVLTNHAVASAPATLAATVNASALTLVPIAVGTASILGPLTALKFYCGATLFLGGSIAYYVFAQHSTVEPVVAPLAASAVPAAVAIARTWPAEEKDARDFLARHPEVKQALIARYHAHFKTKFAHTYRKLGLSKDEIAELQILLCEGEYYSPVWMPALKLPVGEGMTQPEVQERIQRMLGPVRYRTWQSRIVGTTARRNVEDAAAALAFSDQPLTSHQAGVLLDFLAKFSRQRDWEKLYSEAARFLSPRQIDALRGLETRSRYGQLLLADAHTANNATDLPSTPEKSVPDAYQNITRSPEILAAWTAWQHVTLATEYLPLYERLRLSAGQRTAFEDILIQNTLLSLRRESSRDSAKAETAAKKSLLGEEGFAQLREFTRTKSIYPFVTGFASHAALSGHALTRQQCEQLAQQLIACTPTNQSGWADPALIDWKKVDEQSRRFLSPAQIELLQTTEQRGTSRFRHALDNAIRAALEADARHQPSRS